MTLLDIQRLDKHYGSTQVLFDINFSIAEGEIVGLIGPNGAGKSTLLKAIMGLVKYKGHCSIFGKDPFKHRAELLREMSYIADVASLPSWMKVKHLLNFVADVHPQFNMAKAQELLQNTPIQLSSEIATLSKGMKTRLHLCIILAIDTQLLILDEPTLGLDVLVRREFQDRLIQDYYNQQRSILITTHQVDEIESILTRVLFIKEGRIALDIQLSDLKQRYQKLRTNKTVVFNDPQLTPIYQRALPDATELIFKDVEASQLAEFGDVITPSLEDLFVASNAAGGTL